jgi:hypothetical protein
VYILPSTNSSYVYITINFFFFQIHFIKTVTDLELMLENMIAELYNVKYQRYMHREFGGGKGFGSPLTIRELFVFETTPKL